MVAKNKAESIRKESGESEGLKKSGGSEAVGEGENMRQKEEEKTEEGTLKTPSRLGKRARSGMSDLTKVVNPIKHQLVYEDNDMVKEIGTFSYLTLEFDKILEISG